MRSSRQGNFKIGCDLSTRERFLITLEKSVQKATLSKQNDSTFVQHTKIKSVSISPCWELIEQDSVSER